MRAGEGSQGGDGFVAVSRAADNFLHRVLFFDSSNPFVSVSVEGERICAVSNHDLTWMLDLETLAVLDVARRVRDSST